MKLRSRKRFSLYTVDVKSIPVNDYNTTKQFWFMSLVVLAVGLSLGIQDSRPVVGFEVGLSIHINLDIDGSLTLADWEGGDTNGGESSSNKTSNSRWAPLSDNFSGLQGELGSKNGVLDSSVSVDLTERKGLVDRRALVSKSVNRSAGVDGDADSKTTGDTRGGGTWVRKIRSGDAGNVLKLGGEFGHIKRSAGDLSKDVSNSTTKEKTQQTEVRTLDFCGALVKAAEVAKREARIESFIFNYLMSEIEESGR